MPEMLKHQDSSAIVAVTDIARAMDFYGNTLGLDMVKGDDNVMQFKTGTTTLVVYNAAVWGVGDEIETIVADLRAKGVSFEHYPGMDYKDGIHSGGDFKMVWFKDPDGNILHLNNM
jgi:catechol 2,3-dioxygenase-like lactoylglutathione lyase family enzyme